MSEERFRVRISATGEADVLDSERPGQVCGFYSEEAARWAAAAFNEGRHNSHLYDWWRDAS